MALRGRCQGAECHFSTSISFLWAGWWWIMLSCISERRGPFITATWTCRLWWHVQCICMLWLHAGSVALLWAVRVERGGWWRVEGKVTRQTEHLETRALTGVKLREDIYLVGVVGILEVFLAVSFKAYWNWQYKFQKQAAAVLESFLLS